MIVLILAVVIGFLVGVSSGLWAVKGTLKLYRSRLQDARRIINASDLDQLAPPVDQEGIKTLEEYAGGPPVAAQKHQKKGDRRVYPPAALDVNALLGLSEQTRINIEIARLEDGLPPRDPLTGLTDNAIETITLARIDEGWDA